MLSLDPSDKSGLVGLHRGRLDQEFFKGAAPESRTAQGPRPGMGLLEREWREGTRDEIDWL